MARRRRRRGLGGEEAIHVSAASRLLTKVDLALKNIGPTCKSHIRGTATAMGMLGKVEGHLDQVNVTTMRNKAQVRQLFAKKNSLVKKVNRLNQLAADSCSTSKQLRGSRRRR